MELFLAASDCNMITLYALVVARVFCGSYTRLYVTATCIFIHISNCHSIVSCHYSASHEGLHTCLHYNYYDSLYI